MSPRTFSSGLLPVILASVVLTSIPLRPAPASAATPPAEPTTDAEPAPALPDSVVRELAKPPKPFDRPGDADAFYRLKRQATDGEALSLDERYRRARERMARMPRFSTRLGRRLAPGAKGLGSWSPLGPGNIGGRVRALVIHPDRPNFMWAAGVSGGLWKTTNGGNRWTPLADMAANIAVSSLAIDPTNPDVLYAGTGEGFFRELIRETELPLRGATPPLRLHPRPRRLEGRGPASGGRRR